MDEDIPQQPSEQVRIKYLRVFNLGDVMFTDRHDGVPLKIKPGESKHVPLNVALHIFGWRPEATPEELFRHIQRRQGWNTPKMLEIDPTTGKSHAETNFSKLKIEPVLYKLVEVERDGSVPIPADPELPEETPRSAPRRVDVRA